MKNIPETVSTLVLRTDFSDDLAWDALGKSIRKPHGFFRASVSLISDAAFSGLLPEQLPGLVEKNSNHTFIFIVDRLALVHPEHPVLVVDLFDEPGRTFRVVPSALGGVENNLALGNMDFIDFSSAVDLDGVFRGFRRS